MTVLIGALVLTWLVLQVAVLPHVVRQAARRVLRQMGWPRADLEVRQVGPFGADIINLRLNADEDVRVGAVSVSYAPWELAKGRLRTLTVVGAEVRAGLRDGRIELGPLTRLTQQKPSGAKGSSAGLPLQTISIRSCALRLNLEGRELWLPMEGRITPAGAGMSCEFGLGMPPGIVRGQARTGDGSTPWHVEAQSQALRLGALAPYVPDGMRPLFPVRFAGTLRAELVAEPRDSAIAVQARLRLDKGWVRAELPAGTLEAKGLDIRLSGNAMSDGAVSGAEAEVKAQSVSWRAFSAFDVKIGASAEGATFRVAVTARGRTWRLARCEVSGPLPWHRDAQAAPVLAALEAHGTAPEAVLQDLAGRGIGARRLGEIALRARAHAPWSALAQRSLDGIRLDELALDLAPGKLAFTPAALEIPGLAASVRATGEVDAGSASVRVSPGSWVGLRAVRASGLAAESARPDTDVLRVSLGGTGAQALLAPKAGAESLRLTAAAVGTDVVHARLHLNDTPIAEGVSGRIEVSTHYDQSGLSVSLLPGAGLNFAPMLPGVDFGSIKLSLDTSKQQPLFAWKAGQGPSWRAALAATSDSPLKVVAGTVTCEAKRLRADIEAHADSEGLHSRGEAELVDGRVGLGANVLAVQVSRLLAKASVGADPKGKPALRSSMQVDGLKASFRSHHLLDLPGTDVVPVRLEHAVDTGTGRATLSCALQPDKPLTAEAEWSLAGPQTEANVSASCRNFTMAASPHLKKMVEGMTGLELDGSVSLDARLRVDSGGLKPRVRVEVAGASLASKNLQAKADGIAGAVTFAGFSPLATLGSQRFSVKSAQMGNLRVADGEILFRLEAEPPALFLERTEWDWAGGRLYTHAVRVDFANPVLDVRVFADGLQVQQLLRIMAGEDMDGRGVLYGMLPVVLPPGKLSSIRFKPGFLYAKPGIGWWRLGPASGTMVTQVLEGALVTTERDKAQRELRRRLIRALTHFEFDTLKVDFLDQKPGISGRVEIRGRSRDRANPVILDAPLAIELPGLDEQLRRAIVVKERTRSAFDDVTGKLGDQN